MRRVKVALDANIPERVVRMLNSGFKDTGYEFHWEPSFAPASAEDEFWAAAFQRFGGSVVITGDKNIAKRPHQIAAFRKCGLVGFFCTHKWSEFDLAYKCGHLIKWWPEMRTIIERGDKKCWWVPGGLRGEFKEVISVEQQPEKRKKSG
ncbi:MAG: hypothetical protein ACK4FK_14095 [Ferrovibrio sp.]|uniref:PIN-like domain-containing protein n=1 Tax=Ferrovibrio sp. TaxID=1917215 RepID=UPI00391BC817